MSYTVSDLLAVARKEIGYREKESNAQLDNPTANAGDENYTKYARDLAAAGYYQASKQGFAWCDMFHDHCHFVAAGRDAVLAQKVTCQSGPYGAGCYWSAKYYKDAGRFYTKNPQPGDQIFFNDYAHTGIIEKVENGIITTIEGNTSNMVARRTYKVGDKSIDGYGRPYYAEEKAEEPAPAVSGIASTGSEADEKALWKFLIGKGLNHFAAAGIMGNLYAESALRSNNLQNSGERKLDLTDAEYTAEIDAGARKFEDGHGYGLAQWTYPTRKTALLNFAKAAKKSIGDFTMQLDFLWKELQGYTSVMKVLKSATSVQEASDIFMCKYENPADQSQKAKDKRAAFGQKYFDKYATETKSVAPAVKKGSVVYITTNAVYYGGTTKVPEWVRKKKWIVKEDPVGNRAVIDKSTDGKNSICSPIDVKYLVVDEPYHPDDGDEVNFIGTEHFTNANAAKGKPCKPGKARVTGIYKLGESKHPYHVIATDDSDSDVYGWVDADTITKL